jgi:hypothetical protein
MLIFDIETDGLVHDVSSIHCAVIYDTETDEYQHYNDSGTKDPIVRAVTTFESSASFTHSFLLSVLLSTLFYYLVSITQTLWR